MLLQSYQYPNLSEGADSVGGQLRGDKECPFSGVTKSGRIWRKVPESGARSVTSPLPQALMVERGPVVRYGAGRGGRAILKHLQTVMLPQSKLNTVSFAAEITGRRAGLAEVTQALAMTMGSVLVEQCLAVCGVYSRGVCVEG